MPNMLRFASIIVKCPDFSPKMSGILDTRIPTLCNSAIAPGAARMLFYTKLQLKLEVEDVAEIGVQLHVQVDGHVAESVVTVETLQFDLGHARAVV